jgi:hypothetical protein
MMDVALFGEAGVGGLCARPCILNLNYNGRLEIGLHNLDPLPPRTRPLSSSAIPAPSMSVPAAAVLICPALCHLLPDMS